MMRKFLFAIAACTLSLASCDSSDNGSGSNEDGDTKPEVPALTEGITAEAYYKGDPENVGFASYWINFYPDNIDIDDFGDITGDGYVLCISFFAPQSGNPDYATLSAGTYTASADEANMTFISENAEESYLLINKDGSTKQIALTGGTIEIKKYDNIYEVVCNLTLEGGEAYEYKYVGELIFRNRSGNGNLTTITENKTVSGLTNGYGVLLGESIFEGAESDMAYIALGDDDFDVLALTGKGTGILIYFNIPVGSTEIPDGTYQMLQSGASIPAQTLVPGMIESIYVMGTWYFSGIHEAALCDGSVTISHTDSNYDISFELKDGYGHTVTGSYKGELEVEAE